MTIKQKSPAINGASHQNSTINFNITKPTCKPVLDYIGAGYILTPLQGKTPIIKNWVNTPYDPLLTEEDFLSSNYGIVLQDDDLVIDVDVRSFKDNINSLDKLSDYIKDDLKGTLTVKTGGGGYHIYFKKPESWGIKERIDDLSGIEFKTKGRQVVGAGCLHPGTGKYYKILRGFDNIRQAPEALLKLIEKTEQATKKDIAICNDTSHNVERFIKYIKSIEGAVSGNGGDNYTFTVACKGKDYGLTPQKTSELLLEYWNDKCQPPWTSEEIERKVLNAYTYSSNTVGCNTAEADFKEHIKIIDYEEETEREAWLNKYIPNVKKFKLGCEYKEFCTVDLTISPHSRVYPYQGCYVLVTIIYDKSKERNFLSFRILSNYVIEAKKNIIEITENNEERHNLEIIINGSNNKASEPIILDPECKVNPKKAAVMISEKGNFIDVFKELEYKQILFTIFKDCFLTNKYVYQTPGKINVKGGRYWLYSDAIINLETKEIIESKLDNYLKITDDIEIQLGRDLSDRPYLKYDKNINVKELTGALINNLCRAYNNTIEPFLIIGIAIMCPFVGLFTKEINGFPIVWSYGLSGGGKSSLLDIISALYGFNKGFSQSGSSTLNKVWHTLSQYKNIPVMFEETSKIVKESRFENDLKCWYDRKKRGRMLNAQKSDDLNVNGIPMFSSNNLPPQSDAVLNRLLFTTFRPDNFTVGEAKRFNPIRDKQLSNLLPEILKYSDSEILEIFEKTESILNQYEGDIDTRSFNNIKVAITGILLLFQISEIELNKNLLDNLENYMNSHSELYQTDNAWDTFLSYLTVLKNNYKAHNGFHYSVDIENNRLKINHNIFYPLFAKEYRIITGLTPPTLKDVLCCANQDKRVIPGKKSITKNLKIGGKQTNCLELNLDKETLESLI